MIDKSTDTSSAWDWPLLFYVGTVLLNMSPAYFWSCTPRKLNLLSKQHIELNSKKTNSNNLRYIDQVL
jgi:hypothetical protein